MHYPLEVRAVFVKTALAVASAFWLTSAHATATASAAVGDVRLILTDLDLLDDITPWISFADGVNSQIEFKAELFGEDVGYTNIYGSQPFDSITGTINLDNAYVHGSVVATSGTGPAIASLISADGAAANGWSFTNRVHAPGFPFGFTLSPKTSVQVVALSAFANANTSGADGEETTEAEAAMEIWNANGPGFSRASVFASSSNLTDEDGVFEGQSDSDTRANMSVTLANTTASSLSGGLLVSAYVWGQSNASASAVPEPQSWAMLLLGLGLVGWTRTRHNKNR